MELAKCALEGKVVDRVGVNVGELIEKLQEFDRSLPVCTIDGEYGLQHDVSPRLYKLSEYEAPWIVKDMQVEPCSEIVVID